MNETEECSQVNNLQEVKNEEKLSTYQRPIIKLILFL